MRCRRPTVGNPGGDGRHPLPRSCLAYPLPRGEHRTVTLPDYQGVGVGHRLSNFCAALWKTLGHRAVSTTSHPAFIAARLRSTDWRLTRSPALAKRPGRGHGAMKHSRTRLTAGFEYVGPALDYRLAQRLV